MAKLRNSVLTRQPSCIYCGGLTPATQVDHVPAIAMFDGRERPSGLEVSACQDCHNGTRQMDLVASFLSRIYPDPTTDQQRLDVNESIRALFHNFPYLARELGGGTPYGKSEDDELHGLAANGPILTATMLRFAARIGFALHEQTTGRVVSIGGVYGGDNLGQWSAVVLGARAEQNPSTW